MPEPLGFAEQQRSLRDERLRTLVQSVASGDEQAFTDFCHVVSPAILARARTVVNETLAEEVRQVVLLTVWENADRFDQRRGSVMAWLLTISRNRAIDRARSEARQQHKYELAQQLVPAMSNDVEEEIGRLSISLSVSEALSRLPSEQRESIECAFYGGVSYSEAANQLGLPVGTVKSRIRKGLRALGDLLVEVER